MSTPVPSAISPKRDRLGGMLDAKAGAAAVFLLFAGVALHVRSEAAAYGPLHRVRAEAMASASAPHWVEVTGWPDSRVVSESRNGDEHVFFGLRPARDTASDALVPVFVEGDPEELATRLHRNEDSSVTIRGLAWHSMGAPVRQYLAQQGVTLAPDPWVLNPLQSPAQQARQVPWILGMGAAIALFVWLRFRRRAA